MEWNRIEDHWAEYKPLAREKWPRLGDLVLDRVAGSRDRLIDAIQTHYGVSREQARREVGYWEASAPMERAARAQAERMAERRRRRTGGYARVDYWRERIADTGSDLYGRSRETLGRAGDEIPHQVNAHPVASLIVALGVGALVGGLVRRS